MAGGKVRHWKHGWIPVSPEAKAFVAGKGPKPGHWSAPGPKGTSAAHTRVFISEGYKPLRVKPTAGQQMINAMKAEGGFTYDPRKGGLVKVGTVKGVAVAVPGTETPVGSGSVSRADFVRAVADVIMQHGDKFADGAMLGGWYSSDRDTYMVEVTDVIPDRETAISEGKRRNQEGVFDLGTGEYIDTGGTGDA
jgi:hypothetical protein